MQLREMLLSAVIRITKFTHSKFGAPCDSTTSYRPGTRFGSRAIRSETTE
jgi:arginase family enzyme